MNDNLPPNVSRLAVSSSDTVPLIAGRALALRPVARGRAVPYTHVLRHHRAHHVAVGARQLRHLLNAVLRPVEGSIVAHQEEPQAWSLAVRAARPRARRAVHRLDRVFVAQLTVPRADPLVEPRIGAHVGCAAGRPQQQHEHGGSAQQHVLIQAWEGACML
eukprot:7385259-Prymnesium_polylepis.4